MPFTEQNTGFTDRMLGLNERKTVGDRVKEVFAVIIFCGPPLVGFFFLLRFIIANSSPSSAFPFLISIPLLIACFLVWCGILEISGLMGPRLEDAERVRPWE